MKGALLLTVCLVIAALGGANPADYDPFFDNTHDTYHLVVAAAKFKLPQDDGQTDGEFEPPAPGPNAQACKDVWDKGVPCPSDGKFYGYWGELQPEYCDNNHFMPDQKTLKPDAEKCTCNIAMMTDRAMCPMMSNGEPAKQVVEGPTCKVYCREKDHCHCVNVCDAYMPDGQQPAGKSALPPKAPKKTRK